MKLFLASVEVDTDVLFEVDKWQVRELSGLSPDKVDALWQMLQKHKTLFSDVTAGNKENFVQALIAPNTMWFEVREEGVLVGVIWFGQMYEVTDCLAHMVFFDRRPAEKLEVSREMMRWMFKSFPIHRITVMPPVIYYAVIRLLEKLGMRQEGRKRESVLLGGKWVDQLIFGILRTEV
jgi:RimJ/RimL family protein N-acetyltransferase